MVIRTLPEIFEQLKTDFVANTTLQSFYGLDPVSTFDNEFSLVSFERALLYIIAVWIHSIEKNIVILKTEVDIQVERSRRWSTRMLVEDAKDFQLGQTLEWLDGKYVYVLNDPSSKIVKLASATVVGRNVLMKVANQDALGLPIPLTVLELSAFNQYILELKAPGVQVQIVSRNADLIKMYLRIYINPLVINTAGELVSNTSIKPCEDAILRYCRNGIDFAGNFSVTALLDALQQVEGVVSPIWLNGESQYGALPYTPVIDYFTPFAGYLAIDPTFPLSGTILYLVAPNNIN